MKQKARVELRLDEALAQEVRSLAEQAGVSVNQLAQGLLQWGVKHAYPGLPCKRSTGVFDSEDVEGVWFGHDGFDDDGREVGGGRVIFVLDFQMGRVVREGREFADG